MIISFKDDRGLMVCNQKPVRQLESDYKDSLEAIDLMIIDRDVFHDKNAELEKKLEIAIDELEKLIVFTKTCTDVKDSISDGIIVCDVLSAEMYLESIKGDQNEV